MRAKLILRGDILALRFDQKSFFSSILGLSPHWDYKRGDDFFGEKTIYLITIEKIHLKCDIIDDSVVNAIRELILFSFVLNKPAG